MSSLHPSSTSHPRFDYSQAALGSNPLEPYQVKDLRLIVLRPAESESVAINCELIVVNADDAPEYEALSWCWGTSALDHEVRVIQKERSNQSEQVSIMMVSKTLSKALISLRRSAKSRHLWVDFMCINQEDNDERNKQVPMMHKIYGNAKKVCIWLDEDKNLVQDLLPNPISDNSDSDSEIDRENEMRHEREQQSESETALLDKIAMDFIRNDVLRLWQFDTLCKDKKMAKQWAALLSLMRKPWFSRRWVVQEIALAKDATIYCGKGHIKWRDFADAVALFVEVEDATHRLTEVMKQNEVYNHIPDFFEDLSTLGATLLVDATSNLYRKLENGDRDRQKSLEYLVSALPIFEVTDPRDAIFSLLAIAKDASPLAVNRRRGLPRFQRIMHEMDKTLTRQIYIIDYKMGIVEVLRQFIDFAIRRGMSTDPTRALDIICRQWAPNPRSSRVKSSQNTGTEASRVDATDNPEDRPETLPSWIMGPEHAAFAMYTHPNVGRRMGRKNADPLVGLPDEQRYYRAAESKPVDVQELKFKNCTTFFSMRVVGFGFDTVGKLQVYSQNGQIPWDWIKAVEWNDPFRQEPPEDFWRTLVADRGHHGRNAPPFFARACHESVKKERQGEPIDTKKLIAEGRCSIVAAFLRRVHAVIWNRRLSRSKKLNKLCLVPKDTEEGDRICILYGCSVPVILRPMYKTDEEVEDEIRCDEMERKRPREEAAKEIIEIYRKRKITDEHAARQPSKKRHPEQNTSIPVDKASSAEKTVEQEAEEITIEEQKELDLNIERALAKDKEDPSRLYYLFIGPCYVHGMMNGEAIERQNLESIKSEVFELH
jgi:hypothetical protein